MPPIKTAPPTQSKIAVTKPLSPKNTITPPQPKPWGPMHKHTGFIIAIVITSVLLLASAVSAYIVWSNSTELESNIETLDASSAQMAQELNSVRTELDEALESLDNIIPGSPFFYTTKSTAESGTVNTVLHSVTDKGDVELFTISSPASEGSTFNVYATPRVGFDGRVWLTEDSQTQIKGFILRVFNTADGTTLQPSVFTDFIPPKDAIALSPDETRVAVVYSQLETVPYELRGRIAVWNLLTGEMTSLGILVPNEHFSETWYSQATGTNLEYFDVEWINNNCVVSSIYNEVVDGPKPYQITHEYSGSREFCM